MSKKTAKSLRSYRWYGPDDLRSFGHRSRAASMGCLPADYSGKPVIAIINTWSDVNPCHSRLRDCAEHVKRGVWQAGGFPLEMPAMSLGETFQKPTTMMYRNLLAMETEELLRSYPADGCVLLGGCDKTTPALLMGAISTGLLTATPYSYTITAAANVTPQGNKFDEAAVRRNAYDFYFQDAWKISPRWMLTYGLRYELNSPIREAHNRVEGPIHRAFYGARHRHQVIHQRIVEHRLRQTGSCGHASSAAFRRNTPSRASGSMKRHCYNRFTTP